MELFASLFLTIACSSSEQPKQSTPVTSSNDSAEPPENTASPIVAAHSWNPEYDRSVTIGNPLKGFFSSPFWGEPGQNLPHSMEFVYVPIKDLLPEQGQYRFEDGLEPLLQAAESRDNHTILRVYLDYPNYETGMPDWLLESAGCTVYTEHGGGCSPNYESPILQETLLDFITALGARYDGDPRLGFLQLGLIGYWGEWHTWPNEEQFASRDFQQAIIEAYDSAFDHTELLIRYPMQDTNQRDFGFHDDSFGQATLGEESWYFLPLLEAAGANEHWRFAPIGGEIRPELQDSIFSDAYILGPQSQDPFACIMETHASWMLNYKAFHKDGVGYQGAQLAQAKEAATFMGYEFTLQSLTVSASNLLENTVELQVTAVISASGVAPFYYPIQAIFSLSDQEQSLGQLDNLQPGEERELSLTIAGVSGPELQQPMSLRLSSEMLIGDQVIRFASTEDRNGGLEWIAPYGCETGSETQAVGTEVNECICDVDGAFYDYDGVECSLSQ